MVAGDSGPAEHKHVTKEILYDWADRLAEMSRSDHRVPAPTIRRWMDKWKHDLTVDEILNYRPGISLPP